MTPVLLPGQSFVEFGLAIKGRGGLGTIVTLAYANGSPGYIPHRSAYAAGGYEVDDAYRYYGAPAAFAPEAGEAVVAAALALLDQVGPQRAVSPDPRRQVAGRARHGPTVPKEERR